MSGAGRGRRRGDMTLEQMAGLILIAAALIVLLIWWVKVQYAYTGDSKIEACRLSVTGYAKAAVDVPGADTHFVDVDCERRVLTFTKNHLELNGKKFAFWDPDEGKERTSYSTLTPGIVNSVAASEMATCWYEFLEGKSYWTNEVDWGDDDTACFVCSELHFSKDAPTFQGTPFFDFLRTNQSRPYPKAIPKTHYAPGSAPPDYFQYLYLGDRICNHDAKNWIFFNTWYNSYLTAHPGASCEEAFFNFLTTSKKWKKAGETEKAPLLDKKIVLSRDNSYLIIFYQYGTDEDKDDGRTTGASYAPLIIPAAKFSTKMCEKFLG